MDNATENLSGTAKAKAQADELHTMIVDLLTMRSRLVEMREYGLVNEGFLRADDHLSDAEAHIRSIRVGLL